jgi:hypothetical protein
MSKFIAEFRPELESFLKFLICKCCQLITYFGVVSNQYLHLYKNAQLRRTTWGIDLKAIIL